MEEEAIFTPTKITELISFSEECAEGSFDANYKMYAVFSYENNTFLLSFYSDPYLYNVYILKANSLYNLYEILINQAKQLESSMKGSHNSFYNEQTLIKIESLAQKEHLEKSVVDIK